MSPYKSTIPDPVTGRIDESSRSCLDCARSFTDTRSPKLTRCSRLSNWANVAAIRRSVTGGATGDCGPNAVHFEPQNPGWAQLELETIAAASEPEPKFGSWPEREA